MNVHLLFISVVCFVFFFFFFLLFFFLAVLGIEPRSSHMVGKCSTTELHPQSFILFRKSQRFLRQDPPASALRQLGAMFVQHRISNVAYFNVLERQGSENTWRSGTALP